MMQLEDRIEISFGHGRTGPLRFAVRSDTYAAKSCSMIAATAIPQHAGPNAMIKVGGKVKTASPTLDPWASGSAKARFAELL